MKKRGIFTEKKIAAVCAVILMVLIAFPFIKQSDFVANITSTITGGNSNSSGVSTSVTNTSSGDAQEAQVSSGASEQVVAISEVPIEEAQQHQQPAGDDVYTYIAKAGDSYTVLVRQAIASYLSEKQYSATYADKLIAEVEMTNAAGSPYLEIGDSVTVAKSDIESHFITNSPLLPETTASAGTTEIPQTTDTNTVEDKAGVFKAVAQAGDSYTTLARQAVLMNGGADLNPAQKVAAETQLTTQAGFPGLYVGQVVQIDHTNIRAAVEYARNLTAEQQLAWQPYSTLVVW